MAFKSTILLSIVFAVCLFSRQGEGANDTEQDNPFRPFPVPPLPQPLPPPPPQTCPICDRLTDGFDVNQQKFVDLVTSVNEAIEKVEGCSKTVSSNVKVKVSAQRKRANSVTSVQCPPTYILADCRCSSSQISECSGVRVLNNKRRCRSKKLLDDNSTPIWSIATCVPRNEGITVTNPETGLNPTRTCPSGTKMIRCLLDNRDKVAGIIPIIDSASRSCSLSDDCTGDRCRISGVCEAIP